MPSLLPSTEVLLVEYLRSDPDITSIANTRIGTELYAGKEPSIWLSYVTGEERVRNHLIAPVVDIRSYGGTKAEAELLSRIAHRSMHALPGTHAKGVVNGVNTLTLPFWLPDDGFDPVRPRYIGSYQITLHPTLS